MPTSEAALADDIHPALRGVALLEFVPPEVRRLVALSFTPAAYPFGATILREGDPSDSMFVLVAGRARVLKAGDGGQEVPLNLLGPGDVFGEAGLLSGAPRSATVRASGEVEVLRLDGSVLRALVRTHPPLAEALRVEARRHAMRTVLRTTPEFAALGPEALHRLLLELDELTPPAGTLVVRQGDPPGPMFVVVSGRLRVHLASDPASTLRFLRAGDDFGEESLFLGRPRAANVEAITECSLLALSPAVFDRLLHEVPGFRQDVRRRVAQNQYEQVARVPLDFADELLPADAGDVQRAPADPAAALDAVSEPFEPDGAERPAMRRRRRWRRFPHQYQVDEMDCGAACLAIVFRAFEHRVGLTDIRAAVQGGTDGISLLGLVDGADRLGLAARAVKVSKSRLDDMPLPAIVHVEGNHWVVLFEVRSAKVRISDPASGVRSLPRQTFLDSWSGYAALLAPTERLTTAPPPGPRLAWVRPFLRTHTRALTAASILALVGAGLSMLIPLFTKVIVDHAVVGRRPNVVDVAVLAMAGVLLLVTAVSLVQRYLLSRTAARIDGVALDAVTATMLALPMSYFQARRTGDLSRRLAGVRQAREFLVQSGVEAVTAVAQLIAAIVVMVLLSRSLTLVFLLVAPAYVVLMAWSARRLRPILDTLEEAFGRYHSSQIDAIKGIETVKATGAEERLRTKMAEQLASLTHRVFKADLTVSVYEGVIQSVTFVSLVLFLWVGARQVVSGKLSLGGLVAFDSLVVLANGPILTLLSLWDELQYSSVLLDRIRDVFEHEPEQGADHASLLAVPTLAGAVSLRGLGFRYPGPARSAILEGIDLEVPAGTTVAIVGRSGSGKTTLVKCLAGLLEPTEGTIEYDGVDLRSLEYRQLRRHIGFVLQDNYLFDDTIASNIGLADARADMDRVQWAAKVANAHDFIERLPLGYDTRVGETGILVSGGQKQRIAIARAIYQDPPVLIFDEATSALDTESERAIQDKMDELLEGRTSFVIAHRLSTIRGADLIVVLDQGRVVERGTHDELMDRQGVYFYLVSQQRVV
jgi:ATP-binding cassette subfamily B protein